jgi:hypothetical protein
MIGWMRLARALLKLVAVLGLSLVWLGAASGMSITNASRSPARQFVEWLIVVSLPVMALSGLAKHLIGDDATPPAGHCRTCGYDLRATPDRCPECGTPVR